MTISEIKKLSEATSLHFFTSGTLKFFHQTMSMFKIKKQEDGRYMILAPMRDSSGKIVGQTVRFFNQATNELEFK